MTPDTLLFRQAHPSFLDDNGLITSQVFMPFPKDDGNLSVYDGDQISAKDSHTHYTQILAYQSHSVWGVTKAETDAEGVCASPDPLPNFLAHCKIDFNGKSDKDCRKIAKKLKILASQRGCLFAKT